MPKEGEGARVKGQNVCKPDDHSGLKHVKLPAPPHVPLILVHSSTTSIPNFFDNSSRSFVGKKAWQVCALLQLRPASSAGPQYGQRNLGWLRKSTSTINCTSRISPMTIIGTKHRQQLVRRRFFWDKFLRKSAFACFRTGVLSL
eukprot:18003_4